MRCVSIDQPLKFRFFAIRRFYFQKAHFFLRARISVIRLLADHVVSWNLVGEKVVGLLLWGEDFGGEAGDFVSGGLDRL